MQHRGNASPLNPARMTREPMSRTIRSCVEYMDSRCDWPPERRDVDGNGDGVTLALALTLRVDGGVDSPVNDDVGLVSKVDSGVLYLDMDPRQRARLCCSR
jgi:hypothetical protein